MRKLCIYPRVALLLAVVLLPGGAQASEEGEVPVNFSFATWLGTGVYKIKDRTVSILNMPIYVPLRKAEPGRWGVKLRLPVALGRHDFDDFSGNVQTLTFVPGIELDIPFREGRHLKPYAQLGLGRDYSLDDTAYIYAAGVKGLISRPCGEYRLSFGGNMVFAGSRYVDTDERYGFSRFDLGVEVRHPTRLTLEGRKIDVGVFVVGSYFLNDIDIPLPGDEIEGIHRLFEIGVSFGAEPAFRFWRFDAPRLGVGYMRGDGFDGLSFNTGFAF